MRTVSANSESYNNPYLHPNKLPTVSRHTLTSGQRHNYKHSLFQIILSVKITFRHLRFMTQRTVWNLMRAYGALTTDRLAERRQRKQNVPMPPMDIVINMFIYQQIPGPNAVESPRDSKILAHLHPSIPRNSAEYLALI